MISSQWKSSIGFFTQHPWQLLLMLLSVSLGSAVVIAVDIANRSASASFTDSVDRVSGLSTHYLSSDDGKLDELLYRDLKLNFPAIKSSPVVEGSFSYKGLNWQLVGLDSFADSMVGDSTGLFSIAAYPTLINAEFQLFANQTALDLLQVKPADSIDIQIATRIETVVLRLMPDVQEAGSLHSVWVTDISVAQELLHKLGYLDRIALILDQQQIIDLKIWLKPGIVLSESGQKSQALEQMTGAFLTNLSAMSLLAMLVAMFLIYNTILFSVVQRRSELAIKRMLGFTARQVFTQILLEVLLIGLVGGVFGCFIGMVLADSLLALVSRTINDLYVDGLMANLILDYPIFIKGLFITLVGVCVAGIAPAYEAAVISPVSIHRSSDSEQRFTKRLPHLLLPAGIFLLLAWVILSYSDRNLLAGFISLFLLVLAYSLIVPLLVRVILTVAKVIAPHGHWLLSMAIRGVVGSLGRTSIAITSLAIAVAATIGVGLMTGSFRVAVSDWLETTLRSDIYISTDAPEGLDAYWWMQQLEPLTTVTSISSGWSTSLTVVQSNISTLVFNPGPHSADGFELLNEENPEQVWQQFVETKVVLISEPLAYHQQLKVGQDLVVSRHNKTSRLLIGGIYRDYSSTQGMIVINGKQYQREFGDFKMGSIGLKLASGVESGEVLQTLSEMAVNAPQEVDIKNSERIRRRSLEVFDQTFAITDVLRVLVLIVAFVGMLSALMALFLEKKWEYSVLRACGLTMQQLVILIIVQALIIGGLAGLLAMPLGIMLSDVLIYVINQRSFGWSMELQYFPSEFIQALFLSLMAALLATVVPLYKMLGLSLREGLRSQ